MDIVEDLRTNHEYCPKEVILAAADRIEQLEQHCIWLAAMVENWSDDELKKDFEIRGEQVYLKTQSGLMPNVKLTGGLTAESEKT